MLEMNRKIVALKRAITKLIYEENVFGLGNQSTKLKISTFNADTSGWRFLTDDKKLELYQTWLEEQYSQGLLFVDPSSGVKWTEQYVGSAYKQGLVRSYTEVHAADYTKGGAWYEGGKEAFLKQAFGQPEMESKIKLLATRSFEQLKGVTSTMSSQMNLILANGMANGDSPRVIARAMNKKVKAIGRKRALTIARTEIVYAHAEGQLDGMSALGIRKTQAAVEFSTAGDDRVCPICAALQGKVYSIKKAHGVIPVHPNCRCAWVPVVEAPTKSEVEKAENLIRSLSK
jgi:SPP1 gp7 family putative phage head morphogenesis protein